MRILIAVLLLAVAPISTSAQNKEHLDCIEEVRLTVAKDRRETMAKERGGWSKLDAVDRAQISIGARRSAAKAVEMLQVHSSLSRCRDALASIHRTMPPLTADERRRAGLKGK
jgi:hypothetical protein